MLSQFVRAHDSASGLLLYPFAGASQRKLAGTMRKVRQLFFSVLDDIGACRLLRAAPTRLRYQTSLWLM
jgi:hypothetical protein